MSGVVCVVCPFADDEKLKKHSCRSSVISTSGNYACIYMSDKNAFICHEVLKRHIYVE